MEEQESSVAAAPATTGFALGQRVQMVSSAEKNMQVGTVKYIGPVAGYQGLWVGVDWDSGKGRHNGTGNGVHYFDTTGEQSGTFVRPYIIDGGVTVLAALNTRYKASSTDKDNEAMYIVSVRQRRVAVQLVGLEKIEERQKQLGVLTAAMLMYAGVCSAGPPGELSASAPNIRELDLTGNLLPDWHEVQRICNELPGLGVLDLSSSRIQMGPTPLPVLPNLKTLVLNACRLAWEHVNLLRNSVPQIEELHLAGNLIRLIEPVGEEGATGSGSVSPSGSLVQGFASLELLNLEDNDIDSWEEVMKLSALKRLRHLHLSGNKIREIFYPGPSNSELGQPDHDKWKVGQPFENLETLLLAKNLICDWSSIDSLDHLPNLKDVRLTGNPVADSVGGNARFILISRLGKITSLNGSEVKSRERKDSEIRYVRHIVSTLSTSSEDEILKLHPRFTKLKAFHDIAVETVHIGAATGSKKLAASLLPISIQCVAPSVGEKAPVSKKLPASTTVGKLKLLCQGLFQIKVEDQCLFLTDQDTPFPLPLEDDMETLGELGLGSGSTILINDSDIVG